MTAAARGAAPGKVAKELAKVRHDAIEQGYINDLIADLNAAGGWVELVGSPRGGVAVAWHDYACWCGGGVLVASIVFSTGLRHGCAIAAQFCAPAKRTRTRSGAVVLPRAGNPALYAPGADGRAELIRHAQAGDLPGGVEGFRNS